jgi:hypothetical protein
MPADWLCASEMRGAADVGCGAGGGESPPPNKSPRKDIKPPFEFGWQSKLW